MDMMRPVSLALPPAKPDGLSYTISGNGSNRRLTLTWNDNSITETSFVVQKTTNGTTWTDVGNPIVSPLNQPNTHGVKTLQDPATYNSSVIYRYRVVAKNTVGYGAEFPSMTVQSISNDLVIGNPPAAPTSLVAAAQTPGPRINLTWADNSSNETGFVIERSVNGATFAPLTTVAANIRTYADTTVVASTTYAYRVAAVNAAGQSTYATSASIALPAVPAAPQLLTLGGTRQGSSFRVTLTWSNVANETGYIIQRSTSSTFSTGVSSFNVGANVVTYTDSAPRGTPGVTRYYYRIIAVNTGGLSVPSNVLSIVTQ